MFNKKSIVLVIIVHLFLVNSCSDDDEEKIHLEVADIHLKDIGRISAKFEFDITSICDSVKKCTMRTHAIKKNDSIKSIEASIQGNNLNIDVISYPFDFDCADDSCFTVHDISFNLVGINKGSYNVCARINYSETNTFYYNIK
ncbi:hypothetical protein AGMMS50239_10350 [Bacteroidia bacterium]|nr:hypothetical protein AGMMS50239_10350 [Bacteroidia bacterium]